MSFKAIIQRSFTAGGKGDDSLGGVRENGIFR